MLCDREDRSMKEKGVGPLWVSTPQRSANLKSRSMRLVPVKCDAWCSSQATLAHISQSRLWSELNSKELYTLQFTRALDLILKRMWSIYFFVILSLESIYPFSSTKFPLSSAPKLLQRSTVIIHHNSRPKQSQNPVILQLLPTSHHIEVTKC